MYEEVALQAILKAKAFTARRARKLALLLVPARDARHANEVR